MQQIGITSVDISAFQIEQMFWHYEKKVNWMQNGEIFTAIRKVRQHLIEDGQSKLFVLTITYRYRVSPPGCYPKFMKHYSTRSDFSLSDDDILQLDQGQMPSTLVGTEVSAELTYDIHNQMQRIMEQSGN